MSKHRYAAAALILAGCLFLSGCGRIFEKEYVAEMEVPLSVPDDLTEEERTIVKNRTELLAAIRAIVSGGETESRIQFDAAYDGNPADDLAAACWRVRTEDALCAYCVENISYELSQIVSSGKEPEKTELNLVSVLEEAIVHYYDDYCNQGRTIVFQCSERKLMLLSNQSMLLRIFDNLIGNALKHGRGDLTVAVSTDGQLRITFTNELRSVDIDLEHIFDEFYTTDISRTKGNTGLGLAIARQFTELLGGEIRAARNGDLFILTVGFPRC